MGGTHVDRGPCAWAEETESPMPGSHQQPWTTALTAYASLGESLLLFQTKDRIQWVLGKDDVKHRASFPPDAGGGRQKHSHGQCVPLNPRAHSLTQHLQDSTASFRAWPSKRVHHHPVPGRLLQDLWLRSSQDEDLPVGAQLLTAIGCVRAKLSRGAVPTESPWPHHRAGAWRRTPDQRSRCGEASRAR